MALSAGSKLGPYEVLAPLGAGGMGEVYKARDTRLNRFVALKVLPADKVADAERKRRFIQEAQAASALNHPHIVVIHDIAVEAGVDFMVMEYVAGKTLDHTIVRGGLRLPETLKYAVQIADALAAAHEAGIIHRDLKPGNVMVSEKGAVKVLDFGLAKLTERAEADQAATQTMARVERLTEEGAVLGTVAYMSPEQAEGRKVDARSDIFAFGSLLYEMVTGRRAFQGDSKISTITAILRDDPKPVSQTGEGVPRDLEKILARCMRKDPARRFQTMADLKVALEEVKEESESGRVPEAAAVPRSTPWPLYAGAAVVALAATAGLWWWRASSKPEAPHQVTLQQLTRDTGVTIQPAISPDGKLVAYASDRAGDGGLDIWVQQLGHGAQPLRLTRNKADDSEPSFSPDGSQIVFGSLREGGGIYVVSSLGGEERPLLRGPYVRPRFSPDGKWIACFDIGGPPFHILLIPVSGGPPRQIAAGFHFVQSPVWSPDGTQILFVGYSKLGDSFDWWVAPVEGGPPVPTHFDAVSSSPSEWLENQVLYSDGNLRRVPLSPGNFRVGKPERLTTGSARERGPRAIPGSRPGLWRIVFESGETRENVWTLPIDLNTGKLRGDPTPLLREATGPSLSRDGTRLAYLRRDSDGYSVRVRQAATGVETTLLQVPRATRVRISPDGSTVAYNPTTGEEERTVFLISTTGGDSRKLCDDCGLIYDWSPDGQKILYRTGLPIRFYAIAPGSGKRSDVVAHPSQSLQAAVYSPNEEWLAIHFSPGGPAGIFLAPVRNGQAAPESEWIRIMGAPGTYTRPAWSPDGNLLYFVSTAGGDLSLWAQRLDRASKKPTGEMFIVHQPAGGRGLQNGPLFGPALGPNQMVFMVLESRGNIWLAE